MSSRNLKDKNRTNINSDDEYNATKVNNAVLSCDIQNANILMAESAVLPKIDPVNTTIDLSSPEKDNLLITRDNLSQPNLNLADTLVTEEIPDLSEYSTVSVEECSNVQTSFETTDDGMHCSFSMSDNLTTSSPLSKSQDYANGSYNSESKQSEDNYTTSSITIDERVENISTETERDQSSSKSLILHSSKSLESLEELENPSNVITHRTIGTYCHDSDKITLQSLKSVETQTSENVSKSKPSLCSRHEIPVIGEGQIPNIIPVNPDLCTSCSKSMLSYILLIQRFLDGLAKDICRQVDPLTQCFECVKEGLDIATTVNHVCNRNVCNNAEIYYDSKTSNSNQKSSEKLRKKSSSSRKTTRTKSSDLSHTKTNSVEVNIPQRFSKNVSESSKIVSTYSQEHVEKTNYSSRKAFDSSGNYDNCSNLAQGSGSDNREFNKYQQQHNAHSESTFSNKIVQHPNFPQGNQQTQSNVQHCYNKQQSFYSGNESKETSNEEVQMKDHNNENLPAQGNAGQTTNNVNYEVEVTSSNGSVYLQYDSMDNRHHLSAENVGGSISSQYLYHEGTDGILSTLYKVERGLQNISKSPSVWEQIAEIQQSQQIRRNFDEAFVTIARNNAEVLGTLVLGASLLLCGTSKTLCVLVYDSVNTDFMAPLSSMFHEVLHIRSLDSVGTTKLNLLDQPELGVSFARLNVWRLQQFTKCVYLNPDTMVIQNCDELFYYEELSAVPDIGWPDCFNSGVFVFKPSTQTFWELLEHAEQQGSYDGGEQGLLNSYFNSWHHDIHKKLSFIYNLMANVNYTYTPAFKQFGRNVKIVQFLGALKPWHVKFYSDSGQIAHSASVHPTYVQFVHVWLNIYRVNVISLLSPEIQSFAMSQNVLSASEILRFFPSLIESDTDFLLAPPSVRTRPHDQSLQTTNVSSSAIEKLQLPLTPIKDSDMITVWDSDTKLDNKTISQEEVLENTTQELTEKSIDDESDVIDLPELEEVLKSKSLIPGSEVGDYQGMTAWEQGRMDYEGTANSDIIIQRLNYLMGKQDRLV